MEHRRLIVVLRRRAAPIAALFGIGLLAGWIGAPHGPRYRAVAEVTVGATPTTIDPTAEYGEALLAGTIAQEVPTATVVSQAVTATRSERSVRSVVEATEATVAPSSNLIRITVEDRDATVAARLANGICGVLVDQSRQIGPLLSGSGATPSSGAPLRLAVPATTPPGTISRGVGRDVALGGLAGLLAAGLLVLVSDFAGLTSRSPRQVEALFALPVVGVVPERSDLSGPNRA